MNCVLCQIAVNLMPLFAMWGMANSLNAVSVYAYIVYSVRDFACMHLLPISGHRFADMKYSME